MHPIEILTANLPALLDGLWMTIKLTGLGAIAAGLCAPWLALARANGPRWAQWGLRGYISFIRGTPILAQLFLVFYGSGQFRPFLTEVGLWSFFRDPFNCALLVFAVNSCAYQTEILRGAISAVPRGQIEGAHALGLKRWQVLRFITFPNAYRMAWPALGNEVILLMKASALASIVTVFELMGRTRQIFSRSFDLSVYLWAAVFYLALTAGFVFLWRLAERRLSHHLRPQETRQGDAP